MFKKFSLITGTVACMAMGAHAQMQPCSSDEHYHMLLQQYPQLAEYEKQFENQIHAKLAHKTTAAEDTTIYDIPMVVHVVHDYGNENVSDDAIYEAVAYWAQVYMKQNSDTNLVIAPFIPYIGNPRMRLHLATKDPNGNPTKGVVRQQSYLTSSASDQAKYNNWPNNQYVNVWLINAFGAASAGAAAYAYYPSSAAFQPYYDGVICLASYLNTDKTIPHEIGHVMNLQHVWGNTNAPNVACGDDEVDDTPPTKGHTPSGCTPGALYDTTCATGYVKHYTAAGGGDSLVNYPDTTNAQNIMDYTYCERMFTIGQCARMRTALTGTTAGRNNLYTAANLAATGALNPMPDLPPVADFTLNKASGAGVISDTRSLWLTYTNAGSFVFRNASWNDTISSVAWTFSNGASSPTSTSTTTVTNRFSTPGWVNVSLTATSNAGSNTITRANAVYAADTASVGSVGYSQWFANASDIANWPMFNYYNNQFKWEFYNGAGLGDNSSLRFRSFDTSGRIFGTATGDYDDIYTPSFNLAGYSDSLFMDFFTTGASTSKNLSPWDTKVFDSLEVDVTNSGGARWVKIAGFRGTDLANNGNSNVEFIPNSATQWVPRTVFVPVAYRTANTYFRMRFRAGNGGNNLYVDNFSIFPYPAGVREVANTADQFSIYPNPASNGANVVFKAGSDGRVAIAVKDITGKLVYQVAKTYAPGSTQREEISRSLTPAAGMYLITVTSDGMNTTQKLIVY